ncbi:hypothetical protein FGIG_06098 [Fasciola gigantica]|uniref:Uncharacterized protein n=1 Tax=Fasciola gigantica TaxID=46835 RepID=A0A504YDB6_FASGI|nr:hypothetical protein FGIG_06098 [Fasciola gigantica]
MRTLTTLLSVFLITCVCGANRQTSQSTSGTPANESVTTKSTSSSSTHSLIRVRGWILLLSAQALVF